MLYIQLYIYLVVIFGQPVCKQVEFILAQRKENETRGGMLMFRRIW